MFIKDWPNKLRKNTLLLLLGLILLSCQKTEEVILSPEFIPEELVMTKTDIKIGIIGDSISTFDGYMASDIDGYQGTTYSVYYPKGDVKRVEDTWWFKMSLMLGADINNICNCSWSGSLVTGDSGSIKSASSGCSSKRISDLSSKGFAPDLVICYISCNDWAYNIPLGKWGISDSIPSEGMKSSFREAYALMLYKIKKSYPKAIVVCLTNLEDYKRDRIPGWPSNNANGVSVEEWNLNIKEVADDMNCYTIDLQECGINYDNITKYTVDNGLHPNSAGMTLIAKKIASSLAPLLKEISPNRNILLNTESRYYPL